MAIKGIGTDIIEIDRIEKILNRYGQKFLDRLFTVEEQKYCQKHRNFCQHFAGRFAAKEAVAKALGTGISKNIIWTDIEIINNEQGKPQVYLSQKIRNEYCDPTIHLSISHAKKYAVATAILESVRNL